MATYSKERLQQFLKEKTGFSMGFWEGQLTIGHQGWLLGEILGGGIITIDGANEVVTHTLNGEWTAKLDFHGNGYRANS